MISGEDWRSLVPDATARVIDAIDGVGRMRAADGGNNAPI